MQQSKTSATVLTRASGEYAHCVPEDLSALEPKRLIPQIRKQVVAKPDMVRNSQGRGRSTASIRS